MDLANSAPHVHLNGRRRVLFTSQANKRMKLTGGLFRREGAGEGSYSSTSIWPLVGPAALCEAAPAGKCNARVADVSCSVRGRLEVLLSLMFALCNGKIV